jgi:hypothetical protein
MTYVEFTAFFLQNPVAKSSGIDFQRKRDKNQRKQVSEMDVDSLFDSANGTALKVCFIEVEFHVHLDSI